LQFIDSALAADVAVRVSPGLANFGAARVILEPIDGMALISLAGTVSHGVSVS